MHRLLVSHTSETDNVTSEQALLDMYTIQREVGKLDGVRIGMVGDLANGRTVRSLTYLLSQYRDVKIFFVAPPVVRMKDDIKVSAVVCCEPALGLGFRV